MTVWALTPAVRRDAARRRITVPGWDRQRGAVLVEAAIVTPLILLLLLAVIEGGNLLYANLVVDEMSGHAVRTASIARNAADADYKVLQKIKAEDGAASTVDVDRVVVYKATSRDASPSVACMNGAGDSSCSIYGAADFDRPAANLSCGWCPAQRETGDLIGVWIRFRQRSVTGLLGTKFLTSRVVTPVEAAS